MDKVCFESWCITGLIFMHLTISRGTKYICTSFCSADLHDYYCPDPPQIQLHGQNPWKQQPPPLFHSLLYIFLLCTYVLFLSHILKEGKRTDGGTKSKINVIKQISLYVCVLVFLVQQLEALGIRHQNVLYVIFTNFTKLGYNNSVEKLWKYASVLLIAFFFADLDSSWHWDSFIELKIPSWTHTN